MLSRVRGLPEGRYVRMVIPAWLKAGFTMAANRSTGRANFRCPARARRPPSSPAYTSAPVRDTARHTGCISTME